MPLSCPSNHGPMLPVPMCAESAKVAEGFAASLTPIALKCADGCVPYADATAKDIGTCDYDRALRKYEVTVTAYGCRKLKDAEKIRNAFSEQINPRGS